MVNKCKDIASKWRELPYYVQYFGALFIMVTPTLLIIALQTSWGNASSILNLVICLGSCLLSRAALPKTSNELETNLHYLSWCSLFGEHAIILIVLFAYNWGLNGALDLVEKAREAKLLFVLTALLPILATIFFFAAETAKRAKR